MEKRIFGIVLTIMGIIGLIYGAVKFAEGKGYREIIVFSILGAIFFFSGMGLIRSTRDIKKKNEEVT